MSQVSPAEVNTPEKSKTRGLRTPLDPIYQAIARRVGGSKAKEVERFLKFATVGTIGFVVDFGTVIVLQATVFPPVDETGQGLPLNVAIATTIAFVAAVISNFIWNRFWTYPDSRSRSIQRQLVQFAIVSVSGWSARTLWITLAHQPVGQLLYPSLGGVGFLASLTPEDGAARLGTMVTQFIGVFVVMIWNFFVNRYWTYNDVE
jgi:putative flippase GtrA